MKNSARLLGKWKEWPAFQCQSSRSAVVKKWMPVLAAFKCGARCICDPLLLLFYIRAVIWLSPGRASAPEALWAVWGLSDTPGPVFPIGVHPAAGGREALASVPADGASGAGVQPGGRGQDREAHTRVHTQGTGLPVCAPSWAWGLRLCNGPPRMYPGVWGLPFQVAPRGGLGRRPGSLYLQMWAEEASPYAESKRNELWIW